MKNDKVSELEDVLFEAVITELKQEPTAGWAQVARGLLSDYRASSDDIPAIQSEEIKSILKDSAPFKISTGG